MTVHAFRLNPGSVTQGICSCGNWDGHVDNHHLHARTQNGHNVKQPTDYLDEAKQCVANLCFEPAGVYALIAIAEAMKAASAEQIAAATAAGAAAGAEAAIGALTTIYDVFLGTGSLGAVHTTGGN